MSHVNGQGNGRGNGRTRTAQQRLSAVIPPEHFGALVEALQGGGVGMVMVIGDDELVALQEKRSVTLKMQNGDCYVLVPERLFQEAYGGAH